MRSLLTLLLMVTGCQAASPSFSSFNTNQFSTNNLFISIKDGVLITNLNVITQLTLNSTNIVNLFAPSSVTNGLEQLWRDVASIATLTNSMQGAEISHNVANGDDDDVYFDIYATSDGTFNDFSDIFMIVNTNSTQISLTTDAGGVLKSSLRLNSGDGSGFIELKTNGTNEFYVANGSGYTGAGTLFLSDDGTYKAGTGLGTTINPTDGYLPYRSNATTFGDSPFFVSTNRAVTQSYLVVGTNTLDYYSASSDTIALASTRDVAAGETGASGVFLNGYNGGPGANGTHFEGAVFAGISASHSISAIDGAGTVTYGVDSQATVSGLAESKWLRNSVVHARISPYQAPVVDESPYYLSSWYDQTTNAVFVVTNSAASGPNIALRVVGLSGYTGAGTLFLSDDGTYKTAGGSGSSPFTNIAGIVQYSPGQAVTNELRVVSGSADAATNVAFRVDTAAPWSASGSLLAAFGNAGTNAITINNNGAITVGRDSDNQWGSGGALVSLFNADMGEPAVNELVIGVTDTANSYYSYGNLSVGANNLVFALGDVGGDKMSFNPTVTSTGTAVAYTFDTSNTLTNGDSFATFGNAGVPLITLAPAEAGNPAAQIIFGPGTTNVLYRSGNSFQFTNGATSVYLMVRSGAAANANSSFGTSSAGHAQVLADTGRAVVLGVNNGTDGVLVTTGLMSPSSSNGTLDLGSQNNQWNDIYLDSRVVWNGNTNSLFDSWSAATPEGVTSSRPGSLVRNTTSGALHKKAVGTGNTGYETVHSGNMASLAADATSVDTTMANLSISATVQNGTKYSFKLVIFLANSTPTDGAIFDFDGGSATATNFRVHGTAFGSALSGSAQSSALATDHTVTTVTGDNMMEFNGSFEPSSTGTFIPRFAESVDAGGTLTVYRGSNLILTEIP